MSEKSGGTNINVTIKGSTYNFKSSGSKKPSSKEARFNQRESTPKTRKVREGIKRVQDSEDYRKLRKSKLKGVEDKAKFNASMNKLSRQELKDKAKFNASINKLSRQEITDSKSHEAKRKKLDKTITSIEGSIKKLEVETEGLVEKIRAKTKKDVNKHREDAKTYSSKESTKRYGHKVNKTLSKMVGSEKFVTAFENEVGKRYTNELKNQSDIRFNNKKDKNRIDRENQLDDLKQDAIKFKDEKLKDQVENYNKHKDDIRRTQANNVEASKYRSEASLIRSKQSLEKAKVSITKKRGSYERPSGYTAVHRASGMSINDFRKEQRDERRANIKREMRLRTPFAKAYKGFKGIGTNLLKAQLPLFAFSLLGNTIASLSRSISDAEQRIIMSEKRFKSIYGASGGKFFKTAMSISAQSGVNVKDFQTLGIPLSQRISTGQLSEEEVLNAMQSIGHSVKITGATPQEAHRGMLQLQDMLSQDRVLMEDFRRLTTSLDGLVGHIAQGMDLTGSELISKVQQGKIDPNMMFKALATIESKLKDEASEMGKTGHQAWSEVGLEVDKLVSNLSGLNTSIASSLNWYLRGANTTFDYINTKKAIKRQKVMFGSDSYYMNVKPMGAYNTNNIGKGDINKSTVHHAFRIDDEQVLKFIIDDVIRERSKHYSKQGITGNALKKAAFRDIRDFTYDLIKNSGIDMGLVTQDKFVEILNIVESLFKDRQRALGDITLNDLRPSTKLFEQTKTSSDSVGVQGLISKYLLGRLGHKGLTEYQREMFEPPLNQLSKGVLTGKVSEDKLSKVLEVITKYAEMGDKFNEAESIKMEDEISKILKKTSVSFMELLGSLSQFTGGIRGLLGSLGVDTDSGFGGFLGKAAGFVGSIGSIITGGAGIYTAATEGVSGLFGNFSMPQGNSNVNRVSPITNTSFNSAVNYNNMQASALISQDMLNSGQIYNALVSSGSRA